MMFFDKDKVYSLSARTRTEINEQTVKYRNNLKSSNANAAQVEFFVKNYNENLLEQAINAIEVPDEVNQNERIYYRNSW